MKKIYIATVQIAVEADSVDEACQAVGATLTENMMQENFIDWRYNPIEGVSHDPIFAGEFDTTRLREGEIFKNPTNA